MTSIQNVPTRAEVDRHYTWDLSPLAKDNADFRNQLAAFKKEAETFFQKYEDRPLALAKIEAALDDYNQLEIDFEPVMQYGSLIATTDLTNAENNQVAYELSQFAATYYARMQFIQTQLIGLSDTDFAQVEADKPEYKGFLRGIKHHKKIALDPKVEKALATLSPTLDSFENIYGQIRSADLHYDDFEVDGKNYPLSFGMYEDYYAYHEDPKIRRAAFAAFSKGLAQHQNAAAATYLAQVTKEKQLATMYGFDSVIDYLLYDQEVNRSMFNRQIDLIINNFGPVMQKYLKFLQKERGLDKMTFADRLIDLNPEFAPKVSVEESKAYIKDALSVLGDEYVNTLMQAYPERWVDFVQNKGKETGGFCSTPYAHHPYILMSWQNVMPDVYTLVHELGHAGQGILAAKHNTYLDFEPSLYIIEAPSTFNELLLTDSLLKKSSDPRMQRFALTKLLNNTYFHNFITHLLEAAYQREVYNLIDAGQSFDAAKLNSIKASVLKKFFGDSLELNPGAELTWMRQSHYYMGLYSYTYSASLTVSTQAFLKIKDEGQPAVDRWLKFLSLGAAKDPIASANVAGVDITTDKPLLNTINYLNGVVDQVIDLTAKINA